MNAKNDKKVKQQVKEHLENTSTRLDELIRKMALIAAPEDAR